MNGELGPLPLSALTRQNMQAFLNRRRSEGQSLVNHLRWDLNAILKLAIADGLLTRNPASVLYAPGLRPDQPVMSREQVEQVLEVLALRERVFCRLAIYAGLRPGEIIALRWRDICPAGMAEGTGSAVWMTATTRAMQTPQSLTSLASLPCLQV
jgi:integrase